MGKGRKKLPEEMKLLRGTDQPCRKASNNMAVAVVTSIPKSGLTGTAKKVFAVVAAELIAKRLLEVVGVDLVVAYAREMALYHDLMKEMEKEGLTITQISKEGVRTVANPKRKIAESALANARMLAGEFGLTPATRSRIAGLLGDEKPKDDFADFEEVE